MPEAAKWSNGALAVYSIFEPIPLLIPKTNLLVGFDESKCMNVREAGYLRWQQMGPSYWEAAASVRSFFFNSSRQYSRSVTCLEPNFQVL